VAGDRVDRLAAREDADVDVVEPGEQLDEPARRARPAAVPPRVASGPGDRQLDADGADGVGVDVVEPVPLDGDRRVEVERRAGVARPAEAAETLLADGEDDGERLVELGREPLDDVDDDGDGERVVADPRPVERAVALDDLVRQVRREDGVDVREQREPVRRLAEPPDEVAGRVALARAGRVGEALLEPRDPCGLAARRRGDLRERDRVALDICTNVREDSAILLV
jgi:hypothetical protein